MSYQKKVVYSHVRLMLLLGMTMSQDISSRWCKVEVLVIQYIHGSIISRDWNIIMLMYRPLHIILWNFMKLYLVIFWARSRNVDLNGVKLNNAPDDPLLCLTEQCTRWPLEQCTTWPLYLVWLNNAPHDPFTFSGWTMHHMTPLPYLAVQCTI